MQPGPIWGQKKELPPEALRWLHINIVRGLESNIRMGRGGGQYAGGGAYFEQGLVELDDLRLESLGPALLCEGRGLHGSGARSTSDP